MMSYERYVKDKKTLREIVGEVAPIATDKVLTRLDKHSRHFISLSPFCCLGSVTEKGHCDVTPRGDPPGFVKVLDDRTILIPERTGNRRADTMNNILASPELGVIFFVPGISETLRLGGHARILRDNALLEDMAVRGQVPNLAIEISIAYVFFHCAKALIRSKLWSAEAQIDRSEFPPYGQIIRDQRRPKLDAEDVERQVQDDYKNSLY